MMIVLMVNGSGIIMIFSVHSRLCQAEHIVTANVRTQYLSQIVLSVLWE